jgi:hypothetical protein
MADYSESAYKFWPLDVTLLHRLFQIISGTCAISWKVPTFE